MDCGESIPPGVQVVSEDGKMRYFLPPYGISIVRYEGFEWSDMESPIPLEEWAQLIDPQMAYLKSKNALRDVLEISQSVTDQYMAIIEISKKNLSKGDFEKVKKNLQGIRLNGAKFGKLWMHTTA